MPSRCCEFVDSRRRRFPPDRASAIPCGQAGENAMRLPHLDHRSAADHKLHSTPQQHGMNLISGNDETSSRLPAFSLFLPGSCPNNRDRRSSEPRGAMFSFLPAASPKALKAIRQTVRRWALHRRSDKALDDLARMFNPYIQGWINDYGHFYRSRLLRDLQRIDAYLVRWSRYKYKRLRAQTSGARDWLARVVRANPSLFAHWRLLYVGG